MRIKITIYIVMMTLAGCTWTNKAILVDEQGQYYPGKVTFDWVYKNGTISLPISPYGPLSGTFYVIQEGSSVQGSAVGVNQKGNVAVGSVRVGQQKFVGKAYFGTEKKRLIKCDIVVDFRTKGMGDARMVGCGTCIGENNDTFEIIFGQ